MRALILGATGMLGHKLVQVLGEDLEVFAAIQQPFRNVAELGIFAESRTIPGFDARREAPIREAIERSLPDVVINAVGMVKQRPDSEDVLQTVTLNTILPHMCAKLATDYGFRFITISTDCVFNGRKGNYSEDDEPDAEDLYGQSKHWGEVDHESCLTLRTSIIGRELSRSQGLIEWFLGHRKKTVRGFSSAIFSGFPTLIFADIIGDLIKRHANLSGVYHVSSDPISKFDLLCMVNNAFAAEVEIEASNELRIDRSLDSSRFRSLTGFRPRSWPEMIESMATDPTPYDRWRQ